MALKKSLEAVFVQSYKWCRGDAVLLSKPCFAVVSSLVPFTTVQANGVPVDFQHHVLRIPQLLKDPIDPCRLQPIVDNIIAYRASIWPILDTIHSVYADETRTVEKNLDEIAKLVNPHDKSNLLICAIAYHCILDPLHFESVTSVPSVLIRSKKTIDLLKWAAGQRKSTVFAEFVQKCQAKQYEWSDSDVKIIQLLMEFASSQGNRQDPFTFLSALVLNPLGYNMLDSRGAMQLLIDLGQIPRYSSVLYSHKKLVDLFQNKIPAVKLEQSVDKCDDLRRDFGDLPAYAIDNPESHEIDDAISIIGNKILVHVADPSAVLSMDDPLVQLAIKRGSSIYMPNGVLGMFPDFVKRQCELKGRKRRVLTFSIELSNGQITDFEVYPAFIKNIVSYSYEQADSILCAGSDSNLAAMREICRMHLEQREGKGFKNDFTRRPTIAVNGDKIKVSPCVASDSQFLVSEAMILAGRVAARYAQKHGIPFLYRVSSILSPIRIDTEPGPHEHMGIDDGYTRVTSPLRRAEDLVSHYQMKRHLTNDKCIGLSEMQRYCHNLALAESLNKTFNRKSYEFFALEAIKNTYLQDPKRQYAAQKMEEGRVEILEYKISATLEGKFSDPWLVRVKQVCPIGGILTVYQ